MRNNIQKPPPLSPLMITNPPYVSPCYKHKGEKNGNEKKKPPPQRAKALVRKIFNDCSFDLGSSSAVTRKPFAALRNEILLALCQSTTFFFFLAMCR